MTEEGLKQLVNKEASSSLGTTDKFVNIETFNRLLEETKAEIKMFEGTSIDILIARVLKALDSNPLEKGSNPKLTKAEREVISVLKEGKK